MILTIENSGEVGNVREISMSKLLREYNFICGQCDYWYSKKKEFENELRRRATTKGEQ